jgi:hypothetical protein
MDSTTDCNAEDGGLRDLKNKHFISIKKSLSSLAVVVPRVFLKYIILN